MDLATGRILLRRGVRDLPHRLMRGRKEGLMRLIDADALLEGRQDHEMISTHLIWNAPTIDAVPVVRCRDCKWFDPSHPCGTIEPLVFKCRLYGTFHIPDFFCGCGERRTDERSD